MRKGCDAFGKRDALGSGKIGIVSGSPPARTGRSLVVDDCAAGVAGVARIPTIPISQIPMIESRVVTFIAKDYAIVGEIGTAGLRTKASETLPAGSGACLVSVQRRIFTTGC